MGNRCKKRAKDCSENTSCFQIKITPLQLSLEFSIDLRWTHKVPCNVHTVYTECLITAGKVLLSFREDSLEGRVTLSKKRPGSSHFEGRVTPLDKRPGSSCLQQKFKTSPCNHHFSLTRSSWNTKNVHHRQNHPEGRDEKRKMRKKYAR